MRLICSTFPKQSIKQSIRRGHLDLAGDARAALDDEGGGVNVAEHAGLGVEREIAGHVDVAAHHAGANDLLGGDVADDGGVLVNGNAVGNRCVAGQVAANERQVEGLDV